MSLETDLLGAFEEHCIDGIEKALAAGASATEPIKGQTPIDCFIAGYLRTPRFAECLRLLISAGAKIEDPLVEAVLLDDEAKLQKHIASHGTDELTRKLTVPAAFTSCAGITALHLCAEFNSVRCARVLINAGGDVNATANIDADGMGGQTPIFHAVNSIFNFCRPVMELLAESGADLGVRLKGVRWGVGMDWETLILDVTPMSYAQCGLYSQFHRREEDVYRTLAYLYQKRYGTELPLSNVPNRYLTKSSGL
jgi:hypothetical protein